MAVVLFDQTYLVALAEANHMLGNTGNGSIVPIGQVKQWGGGAPSSIPAGARLYRGN